MGAALPAMDHGARRDRLREAMRQAPADDGQLTDLPTGQQTGGLARSGGATPLPDWLLVTDPRNVRYLTGFHGSNGQVVIGPERDADRLITDTRYEQRTATEAPGLEVELSREPMPVALRLAAGGVLGAEALNVSWSQATQLEQQAREARVSLVPTTGLVESLRVVKDAQEIARLELACSITAGALAWLFAEVAAVGRSERDLARALERRFVDDGADGTAFPSIVASGPNAAVPHHEPTDRELRTGDVLTVDCGAVVDGYHADLTRTVAVGHLDDELRRIHELVVAAQAAGRSAARDGVAAHQVDRAARQVIDAAGYGPRFVHGTGHGVGLDIHEAPAVATTSTATLVNGTALTVEPGIYVPGLGGVRIEDTIVITADGAPRLLTDLPHELRTV